MSKEQSNYVTFLRSARNFREFASAEKIIQDQDLTYSEAQAACRQYNDNLSEAEQESGTKLEFTTSDNL